MDNKTKIKNDIEIFSARLRIESQEEWRESSDLTPAFSLPRGWKIKIIPPFGGAMERFQIQKGDGWVSVYFDAYGRLGAMDFPYYEIYPYKGDVARFSVDEIDEMLKAISHSLREQNREKKK